MSAMILFWKHYLDISMGVRRGGWAKGALAPLADLGRPKIVRFWF
jgi:hypothetical protein